MKHDLVNEAKEELHGEITVYYTYFFNVLDKNILY